MAYEPIEDLLTSVTPKRDVTVLLKLVKMLFDLRSKILSAHCAHADGLRPGLNLPAGCGVRITRARASHERTVCLVLLACETHCCIKK